MALDRFQNFVSAPYLENERTEFDQNLYTHSYLGLLTILFCKFITELLSLIDVRIWFPLNILRTNGHNLTFCININIDKIQVDIVYFQFLQI